MSLGWKAVPGLPFDTDPKNRFRHKKISGNCRLSHPIFALLHSDHSTPEKQKEFELAKNLNSSAPLTFNWTSAESCWIFSRASVRNCSNWAWDFRNSSMLRAWASEFFCLKASIWLSQCKDINQPGLLFWHNVWIDFFQYLVKITHNRFAFFHMSFKLCIDSSVRDTQLKEY